MDCVSACSTLEKVKKEQEKFFASVGVCVNECECDCST